MVNDRDNLIYGNQIKDRTVTKQELDATSESTGKVATVQSNGSVDWEFIQTLADYVKLQDNIMINAFRIAINGSLTQFNMIDGIVDEYEDESGIDTVNSLNEDYNSTDDYYSPLKALAFAHYKCNDNTGNTTVTDDGSGANNGVASTNTSNLSIAGKINQAFDFNQSLSEYVNIDSLLTDIASDTTGSFSFWFKADTLTTANMITLNDTDADSRFIIQIDSLNRLSVTPRLLGTHPWWQLRTVGTYTTGVWYHLIIVQDGVSPKMYVNNVDVTNLSISTDTTKWFSAITGLDNGRIGCHNSTGYGNQNFFDGKIDDLRYYQNKALDSSERAFLYNSGSGTETSEETNNMTLISDSFTAEAIPDTARIVLLEEDIDAITLNTDLKAYASRDGGSSWVLGTLADEGDYDASKRILVSNFDLTQSGIGSGTSMEYKFITANNKDLKIHASALNWD